MPERGLSFGVLKRKGTGGGDGDDVDASMRLMKMETVQSGHSPDSPKARKNTGLQRGQSSFMKAKLPSMSELRKRRKMREDAPGQGGAVPALPDYEGDASELFQPHGKRLEDLPTWENMKIKRMLIAARFRAGTNVDQEQVLRWAEITRSAYSEEESAKVNALLALGFPPAVLNGLKVTMEKVDAVIMYDEANKGDMFSAAVTEVSQLLGVKAETAALLLTVRATNMKRVMDNLPGEGGAQDEDVKKQATAPDADLPSGDLTVAMDKGEGEGEDEEEAEKICVGSRGMPVVTLGGLLSNVINFTPLAAPEDKLDLLVEMFRTDVTNDEYISMDDVFRMVSWVLRESDCEQYVHQDTVSIFFERLKRDYLRALRDDDWEPEPSIADHPDEQLLAKMKREGMHRYLLEQVLLSTERSGRVRLHPGDEVIVQNVKSAEINSKVGKILKRDHNQKNYFAVSFPPPYNEKRIKRTNLRLAPGVEKKGDVNMDEWGLYTDLCLNVTPKIEQDPGGVPVEGFQMVKIFLQKYLLMLLFLILSVTWAILVYYFGHDQRPHISGTFGGTGAIMAICGWGTLWLLALTLLSGCQNLLRKVPAKIAIKWGGEATMTQWHFLLGVLFFIVSALHSLSALKVMDTMTGYTPAEMNAILGADFDLPTAAELEERPELVNATLSFGDVIMTWPVVSGFALFGLLVLVTVGAMSLSGTIGSYFHRMYFPLVICAMLHPMKGWFQVGWIGFAIVCPFLLLYFVESYYKWIAPGSFVAREYSMIKLYRGVVSAVEFRVKRPEGNQMVCQQAGQWVELMCPAISRQWQRAAVVSAPEIEDEMVRLQVHANQNHKNEEWVKNAFELSDLNPEDLKSVKIKGPMGLALCDVVTPVDKGGSGKLLLVGHYEGTLNLTAVINDLQQALERPDDAIRRRVSRLHQYVETLEDAPPEKMLEINCIAVVRAVEGNKRLKEAMLRTLLVEMEMKCVINFHIYVTQYATQGTGAECWKRVRKIGSSEFAREGKRDEYHKTMLRDIIHYGNPDWNQILLESRYRWLGQTVDVCFYGEDSPAEDLKRACKRHSYDPAREKLRPSDKTVFNFYHGTSITAHDYKTET
eukprot:TRINITY_DN11606_c0_g1_i2.p1 TRINITY_DN11606_c0_g1~~TRINITY_DN11606_c0_g1_i2.p1  ORF type:complete len:1096 (+),score=387.96 TRINITY_DN11606_c0_g1_i2:69-3356(+)